MLTAIVQIWLMATCALLVIVCVQDWRRERRRAIEAGKRAAEQAYAACKARSNGIAAAAVGSVMTERKMRPAPAGRWTSTERDSLRGVPPRLDYLRTPAEMKAIRERIISETSRTLAEVRAMRHAQGRN